MKPEVRSLQARLLVVIIVPLLAVAALMAVARYYEARQTSQQIYDNALVSIAHVIARDVVLSQGDLLGKQLLETLTKALGDRIFYHIIGDNAPPLLSGYTPEPVVPRNIKADLSTPVFFDATFRHQSVRVVSFREYFSATAYEGWVKVTVWQYTGQRESLSLTLAGRTLLMLLLIISATAIIVWFGVNYGLRPLSDLQNAIEKRSPDDLSPIKRAVPREVSSLVAAANHLFGQLRQSFAEKDAFIANAAHQLRNPIAGLQSQAEAAERTKDPAKLRSRISDVAEAARRTARLTQQLLSMERITQGAYQDSSETFDIVHVVRETLAQTATRAYQQQVNITLSGDGGPLLIDGNPTLLGEVLDNLLDNALRYACPTGGNIETHISCDENQILIRVQDDGTGIPEPLLPHIFERFIRGTEDGSDGCGLGLAIARSITEKHGGTLSIQSSATGTIALLKFPLHR